MTIAELALILIIVGLATILAPIAILAWGVLYVLVAIVLTLVALRVLSLSARGGR